MIKIVPTDSDGNAVTQLAQWDQNVTLYLEHELITEAYPVHFQNTRSEEALVMESTYEDGILSVEVANELLYQPYPITGFVYTDESAGRSILYFVIKLYPRAQPADTVFENSQTYYKVSELLDALEEAASTAAEEATQTATDAASAAEASASAASASAEAAADSEAAAAEYAAALGGLTFVVNDDSSITVYLDDEEEESE